MTIRCPNKECNTKMNVPDNLLHNPGTNVKCPSCKKMFKPFEVLPKVLRDEILLNKQSIEKETSKKQEVEQNDTVVGWLVVHDEQTHTQTYELKEGKQLIGRKSQSIPCEIMIETEDRYMHRNHFYITVNKFEGRYNYLIESHESSAKGNGTFIDTKRLSKFQRAVKRMNLDEQIYIEDGALIQAGRTKIILKTIRTVANKEDATRIVSQEKITKTVIL